MADCDRLCGELISWGITLQEISTKTTLLDRPARAHGRPLDNEARSGKGLVQRESHSLDIAKQVEQTGNEQKTT